MSSLLVIVLIFLSGTLGVAAGYSIWLDLAGREREQTRRRVEAALRKPDARRPASALFKKPTRRELEGKPLDAGLEGVELPVFQTDDSTWRGWLDSALLQSGLTLTARRLAWLTAACAAAGAVAGGLVHPLLALAGAALGALLPVGFVLWRRNRRRELLLAQLPNAFELMGRVLRAGHSVPQAFQAVAETFDDPIATEFATCQEQQNLGLLPETTLGDMGRRTGVLEVKIFIMALLIQRQTGGNLSEVLERLAGLVRERLRLRSQVKTLTAEGRMQAVVLLVLPPVMFFVMRFINKPYADILLEHVPLLAATAVSLGVGALWIRKIINFDY